MQRNCCSWQRRSRPRRPCSAASARCSMCCEKRRRDMSTTVANLVSLAQLVAQSPALNKRLVKYWLATNMDGFRNQCTVKISRRVLFDVAAIEEWLESHRGTARDEQEG